MSDSPNVTRKLAAIMFTDIVGFTKIMADSEDAAFNILKNQDDIVNPLMTKFNGNLIKKMGDGLLVEFPSTVEAVECATQIQESIKTYNSSNDNIEFHIRIGIHLGDIVILGDDILGDGVNIASRIEPLASPDGICITDAVYQSVKSKLKLDAERIDEVDLKHIDDKYIIYKLPKQSDVSVNYNEIHRTKIEISSIQNQTTFFDGYLKLFLFMFIFGIIGMITGIIDSDNNSINEWSDIPRTFSILFNNPESLIDYTSPLAILGLMVMIGTPLLLSIWKYKIQFKDIRNVSFLLDILILNHGYEFIKQTDNIIEYLHLPKYHFFLNPIIKSKYYPQFLKKLSVLKIKFDGNITKIQAPHYHIISLLWKLKKHYK